MASSSDQPPTILEIQNRFSAILSAGPLSLQSIADRLDPFSRGHEDAFVAVFSNITERVEEDGPERYRILPEFNTRVSAESEQENCDQLPTVLDIQNRFAKFLSAGPLSLEEISDRLEPFSRGDGGPIALLLSDVVESVEEEDGVERFRILPEYATIGVSAAVAQENQNEEKEERSQTAPHASPSPENREHTSASASSRASLLHNAPTLSSQNSNTTLSQPSTPPLCSLPSNLSSSCSSPPPTPDLRTPTPSSASSSSFLPLPSPSSKHPSRCPSKRKTKPVSPSSFSSSSSSSPQASDSVAPAPAKIKKNTKKKGKTANQNPIKQSVQCSGITRKTNRQCRFRKMLVMGEAWECGRHG